MTRVLQYLGELGAGGTQSFVMELYRQMDRNKIQFDFVIFPNQRELPYYKAIIEMGGKVYESPRYNVANHFLFYHWWNKFYNEHSEYHVLHSHIRGSASVVLPIAKKHKVITIVHSHSTSNGKGIAAIVKNIMQFPIRYQADYLFACSDKAGVWLYGKQAVKKSNYRMIPNGVDLKRFEFNEDKRREMRQRLEIGENDFVIGHLGRFSEPKNHKFLIEIFAKYHEKNLNCRLLMVGDGGLYESIKMECTKMGISDSVIMPGNCNDAENYYQAMDVFVFPSLWEGLPVSVVEAQANGLPCGLSDTITKDINLTDLVSYLPLEDKQVWVEFLKNKKEMKRSKLSDENRFKLQLFDSATVAEKMQKFYMEQDKRKR